MRLQSAKLSTKIATGLDVLGTLFVEHLGTTYRLPFYHPAIIGTVIVFTYGLFKWKEQVSFVVVSTYHKFIKKNITRAVSLRDSIKIKIIRIRTFSKRRKYSFA